MLTELGFAFASMIPQLFLLRKNGYLISMFAKIVDDIMFSGSLSTKVPVINAFNDRFNLCDIRNGPGYIRYFGFNITQFDNMSNSINGNDKLLAIECMPLSRFCRKEYNYQSNSIKKKSYPSAMDLIRLVVVAGSLFLC